MQKEFKINMMGLLWFFLGLHIKQLDGVIYIQEKYQRASKEILARQCQRDENIDASNNIY